MSSIHDDDEQVRYLREWNEKPTKDKQFEQWTEAAALCMAMCVFIAVVVWCFVKIFLRE